MEGGTEKGNGNRQRGNVFEKRRRKNSTNVMFVNPEGILRFLGEKDKIVVEPPFLNLSTITNNSIKINILVTMIVKKKFISL